MPPLYKGPPGFERFMNLLMNLFITLAVTLYVLWTAQQHAPQAPILTPLNYVCTFIPSYAVALCIVTYLPVTRWAQAAGGKMKGSFGQLAVSSLVYDFIMTTLLSAIMCTINNIQAMGPAGTFMSWLSTYPVTLVFVYIICLVATPICMKLSAAWSGFDPNALPPGGPAGFGGPGNPAGFGHPGNPGGSGHPGGPRPTGNPRAGETDGRPGQGARPHDS